MVICEFRFMVLGLLDAYRLKAYKKFDIYLCDGLWHMQPI